MSWTTKYFQLNRANAWPYRMQLAGFGSEYNEKDEGNTAGYLYARSKEEDFALLIDCGLGTTRRLAEISPYLPQNRVQLDRILITHAAHDHTAELPLLTRSLIASDLYTEGEIVVHCSKDTMEILERRYQSEIEKGTFQLIPVTPLAPFTLFDTKIKVTPIDSSRHYKGAVIWVIECNTVKICTAWDFPPWVDAPGVPQNLSNAGEEDLLNNVDLFICDVNTVFRMPESRHNSVSELVEFLQFMRQRGMNPPGEIWPVHYSGREDAQHPGRFQGFEVKGPLPREQLSALFTSLGWNCERREKEFE